MMEPRYYLWYWLAIFDHLNNHESQLLHLFGIIVFGIVTGDVMECCSLRQMGGRKVVQCTVSGDLMLVVFLSRLPLTP